LVGVKNVPVAVISFIVTDGINIFHALKCDGVPIRKDGDDWFDENDLTAVDNNQEGRS